MKKRWWGLIVVAVILVIASIVIVPIVLISHSVQFFPKGIHYGNTTTTTTVPQTGLRVSSSSGGITVQRMF